jgi:hypothetical protein
MLTPVKQCSKNELEEVSGDEQIQGYGLKTPILQEMEDDNS